MAKTELKVDCVGLAGEEMTSEENNKNAAAKCADAHEYLTGPRLLVVISMVITVAFLLFIDSSIIVTAIPQITTEFHSISDIGWYGSAYLLANCSLQPLNGKLYAHFSSKYTLFAFLALFELGSLICGFAVSSIILIIGRAVAGLGAAGILNGCLEIITASVPLSKRPALLGIVLGLAQLGTVLGPLIGGVLTQYMTWRWCFYINVPAGVVVAVLLLVIRIPDRDKIGIKGQKPRLAHTIAQLDLLGAILFASTVIMFLLAFEWGGRTYAWESATITGLFLGVFGNLCVFLVWEHHRGDTALIPLSLLRQRAVYSSCLTIFFVMGNLIVTTYYLPIWFQVVKAATPTMSGVNLLPMILPHIVFAVISGVLVGYFGKYLPFSIASGVLTSIGSGLLTTFEATTSQGMWIGAEILVGSGRGCGLQMPLLAIQNSLPVPEAAIGTSLVMFCQYFGGAIFSSVGETIFINSLTASLPALAPQVNLQSLINAGAASVRTAVAEAELPGVLLAYNQALSDVFYLTTAIALASFFACWGMGWKGIKKAD